MKYILVLGLMFLACGAVDDVGGTGSAGSSVCAQRSGTVRMNLHARTGNCGTSYESVATASSQPMSVPAPCTGTLSFSSDNCDVTEDATCPNQDTSNSRVVGKVSWSKAGTSGVGILAMTVTDSTGSVICQGTYDAVYTKL